MPLPEEWVQQYNNNPRQFISDEHHRRQQQRIIDEQDRLWQEALEGERQRERDRRQAWIRAGRIDFSNIQAGDTFHIPAGEWSGTVTITGSGGFGPPKPTKPRRRVVSPIFLGPAWVDQ